MCEYVHTYTGVHWEWTDVRFLELELQDPESHQTLVLETKFWLTERTQALLTVDL